MKTLAKVFCTLTGLLFISDGAFSQTVLGNEPLDGVYKEIHNPNRRVVPFANTREADVMWSKRVWRVIDLREKINLQLYYPVSPNANRKSMWDVISKALADGEVKAYTINTFDLDDCFSTEMTAAEVKDKIHGVDTIVDPDTGEKRLAPRDVTSESMKQYMLKEDDFFDKERSVLDVRLLAMGPRVAALNENTHKEDENAPPLSIFWLYFPSLRPYFAAQPVFNTHNDAERRTFDDIMMKRQFSSYIFQESNVFGRSIYAYTKGIDALLEGERIYKDIFALEHDMWQY